jgi:8-oxo-dGTP pyrophosphatase MutT (NUDIX family)
LFSRSLPRYCGLKYENSGVKHLIRKPFSRAFPQVSTTQVAAVCYRVRGLTVEFLLVNTSAGKWTFPKGRIDPSLSSSESAEREALEEAGARGHIELAHFGWYVDTKRALGHDNRTREILVAAYMLEVDSTEPPEERDRNPTWFAPQEAKRKLSERRSPKYCSQLSALVDIAVKRVAQAQGRPAPAEPGESRRLLLQR